LTDKFVQKYIICMIFCLIFWIPVTYAEEAEPETQADDSTEVHLSTMIRSYMIDDQRIQWSGQERTFGVEAVIFPYFERKTSWGKIKVESEFFINQPFGDNILLDEKRQSYAGNFDLDTFVISRLNVQIEKDKFFIKLGKVDTPFGKTYFPVFLNSRSDAPFIRTEAILWWETGLVLGYRTGSFIFTSGLCNGETDKDTNSSKAIVGRVSYEKPGWTIGFSGKKQDGIGSSQQKTYNNHVGMDFLFKHKEYMFSGEFIYDEYGFYRDFNDEEITWPRSLYYRDVFYKEGLPVYGYGGYLNINYKKPKYEINVNYGEYFPQKIGQLYHDEDVKRCNIKFIYSFVNNFELFFFGLIENERVREDWKSSSNEMMLLMGIQMGWDRIL